MAVLVSLLFAGLANIGYVTAHPTGHEQHSLSQTCVKSDVLILGAGMAGVSAGAALSKAGVHDFKIIEYQDRIGGRTLHTDFGSKEDGTPWVVELGTNWITGLHNASGSTRGEGKFNPIWGLAEKANLSTFSLKGGSYYDPLGKTEWSAAAEDYTAASEKATNMINARIAAGSKDISARAALQLAGWDSTNNMYKQTAEWLLWGGGVSTSVDVSSANYGILNVDANSGISGPWSRLVADQRGYDLVARELASEYLSSNDSRLILDSPVTKVHYKDDGVMVHTRDSCYQADYAICTFPLGVLQQSLVGKAPVSFTPDFPFWKAESIFGNLMGIYTKMFYQFAPEDVFWPKHIQNFVYTSPTRKGWFPIWQSLDFPGSPLENSGIFFSTMVWEQSKQVEQQTDEVTMQQGLDVLQEMFPNVTIPQPKAFMYPRWGMTPWIYGSYSNWPPGYSLEEHTNLRANLGRLWFAGEATSSEYWGFLHGAYYEGQLAGEEVAACVGNKTDGLCRDRARSPQLFGTPKSYYNATNGFQDPIEDLLAQ